MADAGHRFVDWLVERFHKAGIRQTYGVPGGGTSLDLMAAAQHQGMQIVLTAREDAAVIMAGVCGVLADSPGLAFTTKGPGLSSSANGLASARLDRMPVLVVTETFVPGELEYVTHQVFDQDAFVAPLLPTGAANILPATADAVSAWLSTSATRQPGPAVLFPTAQALSVPVASTQKLPDSVATSQAGPLEANDIARAQQLLANSARPVIVIGLEAAKPALGEALRALLDRYNIPALSTYMACGTVPYDSANYAGIFTGGALEQPFVSQADLIIFLGLDPVELIRKRWPYQAPVLDLCESEHPTHYVDPDTRICAPLPQSVGALLDASEPAPGTASVWAPDEIAHHREQMRAAMRIPSQHGLASDEVVLAAARVMAPQRRLTIDAGAHMFSASAFWPALEPRDVLISNGLASMGFAIPAGIAAALHDPVRGAVAMTGDGGALMCLGELKTAAEVGAKLCIVVFNDGCLSLIDVKREERQMPDLGLGWKRPDFAAIAAGFGLTSWRAETRDQLLECCAAAALLDTPCLIDAHIDAGGYPEQLRALRG